MAAENSRRIPTDKAASFDEITDAVNSLTPVQLKRLEKYAKWRIAGLGRKKTGRSWEDLFQEAIKSFCSEDGRRWNKEKVDFVKALTEAMRSISDSWKRSFDENEHYLESELTTTSLSGQKVNPLLAIPAQTPSPETRLEVGEEAEAARQKVEIIEALVAKRELASLIIAGMKEEMSGTEIRQLLEISKTQYETEMTWIRRTVRAAFKEQEEDDR
jgi:gas vesicle protein